VLLGGHASSWVTGVRDRGAGGADLAVAGPVVSRSGFSPKPSCGCQAAVLAAKRAREPGTVQQDRIQHRAALGDAQAHRPGFDPARYLRLVDPDQGWQRPRPSRAPGWSGWPMMFSSGRVRR
jgi:hypothetical protein